MQRPSEKRTLSASFGRRETGPGFGSGPGPRESDLPDLDLALVPLSPLSPMAPAPSGPSAPSAPPARIPRSWEADEGTVIVPASVRLPSTLPNYAPPPPRHGRRWVRWLTFATAIAMLAVVLLAGAHQSLAPASVVTTPPPTGRGPWTAGAGAVTYVKAPPPPPVANVYTPVWQAIQPCQQDYKFIPNIWQWAVPPGCYANIYIPDPRNYVSRPGFGFCNWWAQVTHPNHPDITISWAYPHGTAPAAGAVVWFNGNEQGAESNGHWAVAVAVAPDHYWVLISEMNFAWRGGGFGKIDYRYIHASPGVQFFYVYN